MKYLPFLWPMFMLAACKSAVQKQGTAGHWDILKTRNETSDRSECGMVAVNGKLYLIGGDGGSKEVECFDPATATWTKLAMAPCVMHHFQAVAIGNNIYVPEAFDQGRFPDQTPMANVQIYDTAKNTWRKGGEMPIDRRRAGAGAAVYQGKLYLVAGIRHGHSSGTSDFFDVYDPKTDTWTALPEAPHIRDHCGAAVVKDKLYAVGGRNTSYHEPDNFMAFFSHTVQEVDCYDFKTGEWSTLTAKLPLGSGGGATVGLGDKLYYMGGERATATERNEARKNVFCIAPETQGAWVEIGPLNKGRNGVAAAVVNNNIYLAGGSGGGPGGPPPGNMPNGKPPGDNKDMPLPPPPGGGQTGPSAGGKLVVEVLKM